MHACTYVCVCVCFGEGCLQRALSSIPSGWAPGAPTLPLKEQVENSNRPPGLFRPASNSVTPEVTQVWLGSSSAEDIFDVPEWYQEQPLSCPHLQIPHEPHPLASFQLFTKSQKVFKAECLSGGIRRKRSSSPLDSLENTLVWKLVLF